MKRWVKSIGIGLTAIVLSTLGIAASDSVRGISSSLTGLALNGVENSGCGADAVMLVLSERTVCVDRFEASPASACPQKDPKTLMDSERNLSTAGCAPQSVTGALPWRFISLSQAQRACASAGKRLLTNEEWYRASLGVEPTTMACLLSGGQEPRTTNETTCRSTVGAYDMVGNVWEWVDGQVENGRTGDRELPETGYVKSVDANGVPLTSDPTSPDPLYGEDYHWLSKDGVRGMVRGGYFNSGSDGGLYTLNASIDLSFGSTGIGFRCGKDL